MPLCPTNLALERSGRTVAPAAALAAALSLLRGLHVAHASGIYHGDLRPENALVDRYGRVVLSDVGIAAALTSDIRTSSAPDDPQSWTYLAPEQLEGGAIGAYTDVHATGLVLFELLTGVLPYEPVGDLGAVARQRASAGPRPLATVAPSLPSPVAAALDRAVATDPAARHPSATAFAGALREAADGWLGSDWLAAQPYQVDVD
jgi:serine/threonine-protein kinase